jgi:hypothetical protein
VNTLIVRFTSFEGEQHFDKKNSEYLRELRDDAVIIRFELNLVSYLHA